MAVHPQCLGKQGGVLWTWDPNNRASPITLRMNMEVTNVLFKPNGFDLPQAKEVWLEYPPRTDAMPCHVLFYLVHLEELRKIRFWSVLELQIGRTLQKESEIMLFPNIITTVEWHRIHFFMITQSIVNLTIREEYQTAGRNPSQSWNLLTYSGYH